MLNGHKWSWETVFGVSGTSGLRSLQSQMRQPEFEFEYAMEQKPVSFFLMIPEIHGSSLVVEWVYIKFQNMDRAVLSAELSRSVYTRSVQVSNLSSC